MTVRVLCSGFLPTCVVCKRPPRGEEASSHGEGLELSSVWHYIRRFDGVDSFTCPDCLAASRPATSVEHVRLVGRRPPPDPKTALELLRRLLDGEYVDALEATTKRVNQRLEGQLDQPLSTLDTLCSLVRMGLLTSYVSPTDQLLTGQTMTLETILYMIGDPTLVKTLRTMMDKSNEYLDEQVEELKADGTLEKLKPTH